MLQLARQAKPNLIKNCRNVSTTLTQRASVYEPDYLDVSLFSIIIMRYKYFFSFQSLKPKYPQYESLNVQIKGYDYPILESYQRYLHSVAEYLDIDVADW